jgi:predicted acylesterase/phospholipase RssA
MNDNRAHATVVLGGGAPNSTLMTGALHGIRSRGKTFDHYYTSGAGAAVALQYLAPKGDMTALEAMKASRDYGVSDEIFKYVPLGYKTFHKRGPWAVPMMKWANHFKLPQTNPRRKLYNDMIDLWAAAATPSFPSFTDQSLCRHPPKIEMGVDFEKLHKIPGHFFMNAYNITDNVMEEFDKHNSNLEHFWAALAYPLLYEPVGITTQDENGKEVTKYYTEGADRDPLNLPSLHRNLLSDEIGISRDTTVVIIDVLGSLEDSLLRRPRNIVDAFGIQIMTPVVALAQIKKRHFYEKYIENRPEVLKEMGIKERPDGWEPAFKEFRELKFDIPEEAKPYITDWSDSNMSLLFDIGNAAGEKFVEEHGELLPDATEAEGGEADPAN